MIPNDKAESSKLLFELPVFHRHRAGGKSGMQRLYKQYVVFRADAAGDSRFWHYADIRDIGKLGRYNFEIATYEGQFGVEGKREALMFLFYLLAGYWFVCWHRDQGERFFWGSAVAISMAILAKATAAHLGVFFGLLIFLS